MLLKREGLVSTGNARAPKDPFKSKLGDTIIPSVRSLYFAIKESYGRIIEEKPSVVVFANSSGFPLYRIFLKINEYQKLAIPPVCLLPLSSHHFLPSDKMEIIRNQRLVREKTFAHAANTLKTKLEQSPNPGSPIYLIDEVLSGSCVVGIRNALKEHFGALNIGNEIKIIGISAQKHLVFNKGIGNIIPIMSDLAKNGLAFVNDPFFAKNESVASGNDFQLTPEGLSLLLERGLVTFKSKSYRRLVNQGIAQSLPVINLFTTDNQAYNPLLLLNRTEMRLESKPVSYNSLVIHSTNELTYQVDALEKADHGQQY